MRKESRSRAHKLVETFRGELSHSVQSEIGDSAFAKLELMINGVVQEDRKLTANLVEEVVKTLRKDIEIPDLGM